MEGGQNVAVQLGVDYEKAFNRLDYAICIAKLQELGAVPGNVLLIGAFLKEREMTIQIDGIKVVLIKIMRCSPQGSVLGCLLYCVTTQLLTRGLRGGDEDVRYFPQDDNPRRRGQLLGMIGTSAFLYVDDTTLFNSASVNNASKHFTVNRTEAQFEQ